MLQFTTRALPLILAAVFAVSGCSDKQSIPADETPGSGEEWWDNPGAISDHLAAVGAFSPVKPNLVALAKKYAEEDARQKLAATLRARIESLSENWAKTAGDLNNDATLSAYINNESFTRQYVNAELTGTQAYKYKQVGNTMYCLMVLKDPRTWTENVVDGLTDNALRDETLFKTEVMKQDFRKKLDAMKTDEAQKVVEQQQAFQAAAAQG